MADNSVKMEFNLSDLMAKMQGAIEERLLLVQLAMESACIKCVNLARDLPSPTAEMRGVKHTPNYIDDTGNLRSSIGYVIYKDGVLLKESFESRPAKESGEEGVQAGKHTAEEVSRQYEGKLVACIVAGMNYAAFVEGKGFDVLTGPMKQYEDIFRQYLEESIAAL